MGYGSITVRPLREFYGSFAPHLADSEKLGEVLDDLDVASLSQLIRNFERGKLAKICKDVAAYPAKADAPEPKR